MNEVALALSMVHLMEQAVEGTHALRVRRARLRIGDPSTLDPRALESAFETVSRGTVAEGCVLEFCTSPSHPRCGPRGTWIESLDVDLPEGPPPTPPA